MEILHLHGGRYLRRGRQGGWHGAHSPTDWRASAMRLIATMQLAIARAGNKVGHHFPATMFEYSSLILRPQSGDGGWIPTPRNDRVATVKIAYPKRTVNSTTIGPRTFGKISRAMMNGPDSPRSLAAVT